VLQNDLNALSKVAKLFNLLWHEAKCDCCKRWCMDDYLSAGSYRPAKAILDRRKRDGILQESAAGVAKAIGKRNVSVTDQQRALTSKGMLLRQTTELQLNAYLRLNALWILQYALEARGETVRGLTWSDIARRLFDGMFSANGKGLDVLCCYISATKTTEGLVRNIGALPHVDPWLCPFGAVADALVAMFHPPGGDSSKPVFDFAPVFKPDDAALAAAGVQSRHFREAGNTYGFRRWYRVLVVPSATGGPLKAMSYEYHNSHLKAVMMAAGIPDWAAKTHLGRKAAAQKAKERGVSDGDNRDHGRWNVGIGGGAYDGPIPNLRVLLALSGRPIDCVTPTTARFAVPVPVVLQDKICTWLETEEAALAARMTADANAVDSALSDFFDLIRMLRSVFFQSWAARIATASVPADAAILAHPLLANQDFTSYCTLMRSSLEAAGDVATSAVQQVLPQLSAAVKAAVEAVAAGSAADALDLERSLSMQMDYNAERLQKCTAAGFEDLKEHGHAAMEEVKQLVSTEMARTRSLMARMVAVGAVQDVRARDLLIEDLRRPPPSGLVALSAEPTVVEAGAAASIPVTITPIMTQVEVPAALLRDRESVRTLQAKGKLAGVPLFNAHGECVPLIEMMPDLKWGQALDEYAEGRRGMASILEVQQLFGNRWRLRHTEPKRDRYIKLYSERAALYRAFDTEYARRGGVVGISVVVNALKQRYGPWDRNSKAVLKELRRDYPDPNRGTRKRARVELCAGNQ